MVPFCARIALVQLGEESVLYWRGTQIGRWKDTDEARSMSSSGPLLCLLF